MGLAPLSRFPFLLDNPIDYLREVAGLAYVSKLSDIFAFSELRTEVEKIVDEFLSWKEESRESRDVVYEVLEGTSLVVLAALAGGEWIANRVSLYLAKKYSKRLRELSPEELVNIARVAGLRLKLLKDNYHVIYLQEKYSRKKIEPVIRQFAISLDFVDFLKATKRLSGDPKYRLTNQIVIDGSVYLSLDPDGRALIERIIEEKFADYIRKKIEELSSFGQLADLLEMDSVLYLITKIQQSAPKPAHTPGRGGTGPVVQEAFPPCISAIYAALKRGENLSHHQRFVLAAFLGSIGVDKEEIVDLFRSLPDFKEKITRYQVEHILGERGAGKKYLPYSCEKMKVLGLCVADCGVKNPLQFYFRERAKAGGKLVRKSSAT